MPRRALQILEEARQLNATERVWLIDGLLGEEGLMSDEDFAARQMNLG